MAMSQAAKFEQAILDVKNSKLTSAWDIGSELLDRLCTAKRFYVPDAAPCLVTGKAFDDETKALMRLPYPVVAVLHNVPDDGEGGIGYSRPIISVGVDHSVSRQEVLTLIGVGRLSDVELHNAKANEQRLNKPGWTIFSVVWNDKGRIWVPIPTYATCDYPTDVPGYVWGGAESEFLSHRMSKQQLRDEFSSDRNALQNLCLLLSLHNVGVEEQQPSRVSNIGRGSAHKPYLHSYHVLRVDGELWDRPLKGTDGEGLGRRSHFRRGHIRRLDDKRRVWVRSTLVHGHAEGFVEKEYLIDA